MQPPDEFSASAGTAVMCAVAEEPLDAEARAFFDRVAGHPGGFGELSRTLWKAYTESQGIAKTLTESQSVLEHATVEKLHHMHGKINEVSTATELAVNDVLGGLNQGVELVEQMLDADGSAVATRNETLETLRDVLYGVMVHLQFQDITSQQLAHVAHLLLEMKQRMHGLMQAFAPYAVASSMPCVNALELTNVPFDPDATTSDATIRQAKADAVFIAGPTVL